MGKDEAKDFAAENFVQAVLDKNDIKDLPQIQLEESFTNLLVFFLTPTGELFHTEKINYGPDGGVTRLPKILAMWKKG